MIDCKWIKSLMFLRGRHKAPVDSLSARELAVASHLADGKSHKEIARLLDVAPTTVRNHIQRIHEKLNAHTNVEVAKKLAAYS